MFAVETDQLTKDYKLGFWKAQSRRALDSLDLRVEQGEVFGLLGPNGAGKTTTLKLLFRLIFPTAGSARILGKELDDRTLHARVGYLPENPYFYDHLSAEELLDYAGRLFGLEKSERRQRIGQLLERVRLADSGGLPLRRYSKGMVQRVGIAQALINDPEVVFLDEPITGLDPVGRREARDLILELRAQGKTVFFSTHILSDAESLCDRVAILNRGRLEGCGELREILSLGVSATEAVLENSTLGLLQEVQPLVTSVTCTGAQVRLEIRDEGDVEKVLSLALKAKARVVSLNPVKMSLEDYFMRAVRGGDGKIKDKGQRIKDEG